MGNIGKFHFHQRDSDIVNTLLYLLKIGYGFVYLLCDSKLMFVIVDIYDNDCLGSSEIPIEELGPVPDLLFKTDIFEKYVLYEFISISFFSFAFCEFFLDTDKKGRGGMVKGGFPALLNDCGIYNEEKIPIHLVPNGYSPVRNLSNKPGQVSFPNQLDKAVRLSAEITLPENGVHKGNVYVNKVMEVVENRINLFSIDNEF